VGRATDNIAIERLWRSVKYERIYLQEYQSMQELKEDLKNYFHFYNYYRFHQTLGYKKPMEVYDRERFRKERYRQAVKANNNTNKKRIFQKVA